MGQVQKTKGRVLYVCPNGFTGMLCEKDIDNFCTPVMCQNGGSCIEGIGSATSCECSTRYTGVSCDEETSDAICYSNSDCSLDTFCNVTCVSHTYPQHGALLSSPVTFEEQSFVRVQNFPDLSGSVSIFSTFHQTPGNQGYLFFYGTSEDTRNFAVFFDGKANPQKIWLFCANTLGATLSVTVSADIDDNLDHSFALTMEL